MSRDFLLLVFFMNQFTPLEYFIRTVLNFFKNLPRYSHVKVHHRYQWHRWQHRCQWHWRQIFPLVSLVLLVPVANLLLVSTTSVANNVNNYQTADNFKKQFICMIIRYIYYPKVSKKNNEHFSDYRFFPFATGVYDTSGAPCAPTANFQKKIKWP